MVNHKNSLAVLVKNPTFGKYPVLAVFGKILPPMIQDIDEELEKDLGRRIERATKEQVLQFFLNHGVFAPVVMNAEQLIQKRCKDLVETLKVEQDADFSHGQSKISGSRFNSIAFAVSVQRTVGLQVTFMGTRSIGYGDSAGDENPSTIHHVHTIMLEGEIQVEGMRYGSVTYPTIRMVDLHDFHIQRLHRPAVTPFSKHVGGLIHNVLEKILYEQRKIVDAATDPERTHRVPESQG